MYLLEGVAGTSKGTAIQSTGGNPTKGKYFGNSSDSCSFSWLEPSYSTLQSKANIDQLRSDMQQKTKLPLQDTDWPLIPVEKLGDRFLSFWLPLPRTRDACTSN